MTCHEAMRLLPLFLDSELSPEVTLAMEEHIESCASCRRRLESERNLEKAIRVVLIELQPDDAATWREALDRAVRQRPMWRLSRGGVAALALGSTLLVGVAMGVMAWPHRELDLARSAATDHARFLVELREEVLPPATIRQFADIAHRTLPLGVDAPRALPSSYELLKTGQCRLNGAPVAYVVVRKNAEPLSVFLMPRQALTRFPAFAARLGTETRGVNCKVRGARFFGLASGNVVACAVGRADPAELQQLVRWALAI